jgi:hypothetical protein
MVATLIPFASPEARKSIEELQNWISPTLAHRKFRNFSNSQYRKQERREPTVQWRSLSRERRRTPLDKTLLYPSCTRSKLKTVVQSTSAVARNLAAPSAPSQRMDMTDLLTNLTGKSIMLSESLRLMANICKQHEETSH